MPMMDVTTSSSTNCGLKRRVEVEVTRGTQANETGRQGARTQGKKRNVVALSACSGAGERGAPPPDQPRMRAA
jgi:hypothetical protein